MSSMVGGRFMSCSVEQESAVAEAVEWPGAHIEELVNRPKSERKSPVIAGKLHEPVQSPNRLTRLERSDTNLGMTKWPAENALTTAPPFLDVMYSC